MATTTRGMPCRSARTRASPPSPAAASAARTAGHCPSPISITSDAAGRERRGGQRHDRPARRAGRRRRRRAPGAARGRATSGASDGSSRSRTYGGLATMRSNGPATPVEERRLARTRPAPPRRARRRWPRATARASGEMSVATTRGAAGTRAPASRPGSRCRCRCRPRAAAPADAASAASASSTSSSVSGRGISTPGRTWNVAAVELLHAADVGHRLARGAPRSTAASKARDVRRRRGRARRGAVSQVARSQPSTSRSEQLGVERRLGARHAGRHEALRGRPSTEIAQARHVGRATSSADRRRAAPAASVDVLQPLGLEVAWTPRRAARRGRRSAPSGAGGS